MTAPLALSPCPDENQLVGLIEGRLAEAKVRALEDHIDGCPACSDMMGDLAAVIAPEAPRAPLGELVIGRYEVLAEIGAGGMGVVYAAYDPELRRKVALKLLRPDIAHITDVPAARARLLREARLLATLSHPNVVTVYDVGAMGDDIFIAVELIEGRSLAEWMEAERPTWREVASIYVQAARGLLAAHEAGLVHRDVKPANLLLGKDGSVRVTDFGLATAMGDVTSGVRKAAMADTSLATQAGAVVGTPAYMAPEQYAGRGADARSDQFSFCVSLAEAFTGERPTAGATPEDLVEAARARERRPPPGALLAVVARGLSARAADRHADMAAVALALEDALATEDERLLHAGDDGAVVRGEPRSSAYAGWLVALGLLGVLGYVFLRSEPSHRSEATALHTNGALVTAEPTVASVSSQPAQPPTGEPTPEEPRPGALITDASATSRAAPTRAAPSPTGNLPPPSRDRADKAFLDARHHHSLGEGAACLADLDEGTRNDPARGSGGFYQKLRAQCMMMAGDCAGGRKLLTGLMGNAKPGPELDAAIDAQSFSSCRKRAATAAGSPEFLARSTEIQALYTEAAAAEAAGDVERCRAVGAKAQAYAAKHDIASEPVLKNLLGAASSTVTRCLVKNTDCAAARKSFEAFYRKLYPELMTPAELDKQIGPMFESSHPECQGK